MAVLACQSLGLIDVGGIGSIEGDPQKYESPVNHLGLLGALQAAGRRRPYTGLPFPQAGQRADCVRKYAK